MFGAHDICLSAASPTACSKASSPATWSSVPDRRDHRPHPLDALQPQGGHAVRAERVPAVLGRVQHQPRRGVTAVAPVENRFSGTVNHYFLCDRGRFGYGWVNREGSSAPDAGARRPVRGGLAAGRLDRLASTLRDATRVIGIRLAACESRGELRAAQFVGAAHFSTGIDNQEAALAARWSRSCARERCARPRCARSSPSTRCWCSART